FANGAGAFFDGGLGIGFAGKAKNIGDFERFLEVESENHINLVLEAGEELEGVENVAVSALFRIGQVDEELALMALGVGDDLIEQLGPDARHGGEHGPVEHADPM